MSKLVTIFGGSGFVGRYIARRMAKAGWRVRVAARHPNLAGFVRPYGTPGQVEPVFANICDDASTRIAMMATDAVVNCVGTFDRSGRNNFDAVQAEGAGRIARIAADLGIERLVHLSAIGADADSDSLYYRSKAAGEAAVRQAFLQAVILRPSVVFGPEDGFFNRFAGMTGLGPAVMLVGADSRFQPVYVDDVAQAAVVGVIGQAAPGIYELGGPDTETLRHLIHRMLAVIDRRRAVVNLPFWLGRFVGGALDLGASMTGGLIRNGILTADQVRQLRSDVVVSPGSKGFADLSIAPTDMAAVLPGYLWRYRPSGQYADIKASAKRLRKN